MWCQKLLVYRRIVPVPDFCPRHLYHFVPGEDSKLENRGQNGTRVICVYVNMSPPEMTHSEHYVKHVCPNMNSIWTQFDILWPQSDPMRPIFDLRWTLSEPSWSIYDPRLTQYELNLNPVWQSMTPIRPKLWCNMLIEMNHLWWTFFISLPLFCYKWSFIAQWHCTCDYLW